MVNALLTLPPDWNDALKMGTGKSEFSDLLTAVNNAFAAGQVFPPPHQVFRAFHLCPLHNVKVVILGQDPYHSPGQAHGLCFSVNDTVKVPPSLRNIFRELETDIPGFVQPPSGDLSNWALQGVLLLNTILTVQSGIPGSHRSLGWEKFTDVVIRTVSDQCPAVVFMLWGNYATAKRRLIDDDKHLVLTAAHPSPLARGAFSGCRHFSKANLWLREKGLEPVTWQL